MKSHAPRTTCCVISLMLLTVTLLAHGNTQWESFERFVCENSPVCLAGEPSTSFYAKSEIECVSICQRQNQQPQYCIGVNYRRGEIVCDMFYSSTNTLNPSDFRKNFTGCQFIQVCEYFRSLGNVVTGILLINQCHLFITCQHKSNNLL